MPEHREHYRVITQQPMLLNNIETNEVIVRLDQGRYEFSVLGIVVAVYQRLVRRHRFYYPVQGLTLNEESPFHVENVRSGELINDRAPKLLMDIGKLLELSHLTLTSFPPERIPALKELYRDYYDYRPATDKEPAAVIYPICDIERVFYFNAPPIKTLRFDPLELFE